MRRAFHTLKGSGRMVEAFDIGELAWSVENMLNRVIDRTIKVQPHIFHLIDAVIAVVPELVKAFEHRKPNPQKKLTTQYEAWGQQISDGNFPDELANPLPLFSDESKGDEPVETTSEANLASISDVAPVFEPAEDSEFMQPEDIPPQEVSEMEGSNAEVAESFVEEHGSAELESVEAVETTSHSEVIPVLGEQALHEESLESTEDSEPEDDSDSEIDKVLQEIFSQESITHLGTIEDFIREMEEDAPLYTAVSYTHLTLPTIYSV